MNNKKLTAIGCLLMLSAMVAPGAVAHIEALNGPHLAAGGPSTGFYFDENLASPTGTGVGVAPHADPCAGGPCPAGSVDRVSGWYFGPAGPFVSATFDDLGDVETAVAFGGGFALCDMEFLVHNPTDENQVDGVQIAGTTGNIPDNTFNDGGVGAVCHVDYAANAPAGYSTFGCGAKYTGNAIAEDAVSGAEVWIGTTCDYWSPTGPSVGTTLADLLVSDSLDAVNCVLVQDLTCFAGVPPAFLTDTYNCVVGTTLTCLQNQVNCLLGSTACPPTASAHTCVTDGVADAGFFGEGDGHLSAAADEEEDWGNGGTGGTGSVGTDYWAPNTAPGVPFPVSACPAGREVAAVFTFTGANVVLELASSALLDVNLSVATHGWVA